jgi:hypothetical protein
MVDLTLSNHALTRMQQRGKSKKDIDFVVSFGDRYWGRVSAH